MEQYQIRTVNTIVISNLADSKLLKLYRYYKTFYKELNKLLSSIDLKKDDKFKDYAVKIEEIKVSMRAEIKKRGLLVGK